ncbi:MAG: M28 family peptidase [Saprospiraceae bacterium]
MTKQVIILLFIILSIDVNAQYISGVTVPNANAKLVVDESDLSVKFANTITAEDMLKHLSVLASDEYEGRETGTPGNAKAATYISKFFSTLKMAKAKEMTSYAQQVAFTFSKWEDVDIFIDSTRYKHLWDFLAFPNMNSGANVIQSDNVVYLGFGIDDPKYSDYKGNKLAGKIIMINKGEPLKKDSTSWITGTSQMSEWTTEKKLEIAKKHGVKMVLIIEEDIKGMLAKHRRKLIGFSVELGDKTKEERTSANHAYISSTIAKDIIGKKGKKVIKSRKRSNKKGKACDVKLKKPFMMNLSKEENVLLGQNILGFVEGTDKKDEIVVVSAHYDHLGKRGDDVYNGADDNGSGTTTVLELAKAFTLAKSAGHGPRRSILFLLVTGEEKGLLGSEYYAANPIYDLKNTVVDINIDMVGRVDEKYTDNPNYIYVIGSDRLSTDLHKINEDMNTKYGGLTLDYTYNSESDPNRYYYRSDHYNFAKNGIPAIFFFNGVHADYHKASDTVDKINFKKMQNVGRLIFHTIWELSNRNNRIVVDGIIK